MRACLRLKQTSVLVAISAALTLEQPNAITAEGTLNQVAALPLFALSFTLFWQ